MAAGNVVGMIGPVLRYTAHDVRTRLESILDEIAEMVAQARRALR